MTPGATFLKSFIEKAHGKDIGRLWAQPFPWQPIDYSTIANKTEAIIWVDGADGGFAVSANWRTGQPNDRRFPDGYWTTAPESICYSPKEVTSYVPGRNAPQG